MDIDLFLPYDEHIHNNHQVAQCAGGLIAYWDEPVTVSAADAVHMRDDDYVIATVYNGVARAYPIWIIDYYHIINDVIAGQPVVVASCERCQSGNMFDAQLDGKRIKFLAAGFYSACLTMSERRGFIGEKPSQWIHYTAMAISGRYKGKHLKQVPTYHYTWQEWKQLHPDTDVMVEPDNPHHTDCRQGHGRDEYFARPGMEIGSSQTIYGQLDYSYPENEMVLGIHTGNVARAYPLREVKKAGGIVHETTNGKTHVVFAGPRPEQFTMAAFDCQLNDQTLSFTTDGQFFIDQQTGSKWTVEGNAVEGKLSGQSLMPINSYFLRWHAWVYVHQNPSLYLFQGDVPLYPAVPMPGLDLSPFKSLLDKLAEQSRSLTIECAVPVAALPHQVEHGITIRIDGDRLNLYLFTDIDAAADYTHLEGAMHYNLIIPRLGRKKSIRIGNLVLESDPDEQYDDRTQVSRLPDNQIQWSRYVTDPEIVAGLPGAKQQPGSGEGYFSKLLTYLLKRRYDVIDAGILPQCQLYPGTLNGISATIEGYRYAIFRCQDESSAATLITRFTQANHFGELAMVCFPDKMHKYIRHETGRESNEKIDWPDLLENEKFYKHLSKFADSR